MVEIHRERVQDLTLEFFSGEKYSQPANGPGFAATATLDVTLDRAWFVEDARGRVWQEEEADGTREPLRHFAIDLRKLSADDARRFVEAGELELVPDGSADQEVAARLGSFQPGRT